MHAHARATWRSLRGLLLAQLAMNVASYAVWWLVVIRLTTAAPPLVATGFHVSTVAHLVVLLADAWAVVWVGMWYGLTAKRPVYAVVKTFLLVILVPHLVVTQSWPFFVFRTGSSETGMSG